MIRKINRAQVPSNDAVAKLNRLSQILFNQNAIFSQGNNGRRLAKLPGVVDIQVRNKTLMPLIGAGAEDLEAATDALRPIRTGATLVLEDRAVRITGVRGGITLETIA